MSVVVQFAVAALSERRKLLKNQDVSLAHEMSG